MKKSILKPQSVKDIKKNATKVASIMVTHSQSEASAMLKKWVSNFPLRLQSKAATEAMVMFFKHRLDRVKKDQQIEELSSTNIFCRVPQIVVNLLTSDQEHSRGLINLYLITIPSHLQDRGLKLLRELLAEAPSCPFELLTV